MRYFLQDWALCFMVPALIIACSGFIVFLFLVPKPSHVGLSSNSTPQSLDESPRKEDSEKAISLLGAFLIPGVIEFSLCLFSTKLVSYVFLFWLPHYIKARELNMFLQLYKRLMIRKLAEVLILTLCPTSPTALTGAPWLAELLPASCQISPEVS